MTDDLRNVLRAKARTWLTLYADELGGFLSELLSNEAEWTVGYDERHFYYWVMPRTADDRTLPPPIMSIKWDAKDVDEAQPGTAPSA